MSLEYELSSELLHISANAHAGLACVMRAEGLAEPSTLNPQPSTLNPQPSTLNPQPSTLYPLPSNPHPQPFTLHQ